MIHQHLYNKVMEYIDTHCHIDFPEFDEDRHAVLGECARLGVSSIVVPGVAAATWSRLLLICKQHPALYPALGLHPMLIDRHQARDLTALETALAHSPEIIAIGEIGLDYQRGDEDRQAQQIYFEAQLAIARDAGLPVILHVRKAHEPVLQALKRAKVKGGVVHAFNASLDQARRYLNYGFKFGFGGMVSYPRSTRLQALARSLPLDSLVLETDAPDMPGFKYKGQRNSPVCLPDYFQHLAQLRDDTPEEIARALVENSRAVLGLDVL